MTWQTSGACVGMPADIWFDDCPAYRSRARFVCSLCPVADLCLRDALERGDKFAYRAGTTPYQRRRMREMAA